MDAAADAEKYQAMSSAEKELELQRDLGKLDLEGFSRHCALLSVNPPSPEFFYWVRLFLAEAEETLSFQRLKPDLTTLVEQYATLSQVLSAVFNLLLHDGDDDKLLKQWARQTLYKVAFHSQGQFLQSVDDGKALVDMCLLYFQPYFFHNSMIPHVLSLLQTRAKADLWVVGFLSRMHEKGFSRLFNYLGQKTTEYFRELLDAFLEADRFCCYVWYPQNGPGSPQTMPIAPDDLAELFAILVNHELYQQLGKLIDNISTHIPRVLTEHEFEDFWLPFLHSLMATFRKSFIPLVAKQYRPLFQSVLETYHANKSAADKANLFAQRNHGSLLSPPAGDRLQTELAKFDPDKLRELLGDEPYENLCVSAGLYQGPGHAQPDQEGQGHAKAEPQHAPASTDHVGGPSTTDSASVLSPISSPRFSDE